MSTATRLSARQATLQRISVLVIALCMGWFISACNGGSSPAPSPTTVPAPMTVPSLPQVSSVDIVGPRAVPAGSDVTYRATAKLANGGLLTNARPTTWTVDDPEAVSIRSAPDGIGELSAKRAGTVTLTATHQLHTGTLTIEIRDVRSIPSGANLAISFSPDPVPGRQRQCSGLDQSVPSWTFTETVSETLGVGFTLENLSFTLYDNSGNSIYSDTFPEKDYFPANSVFSEEFCSSLFGQLSGFYADVYEGVDDQGNRRAFAGGRLRLLPVAAAPAPSSLFVAPTPHVIVRGVRQRVR